ncbi:iron ABC transporter permease [Leptolyngbya sp. 15MV]|nr:iron ABC transporter permease [Leptolyngbya sp. 15MV]
MNAKKTALMVSSAAGLAIAATAAAQAPFVVNLSGATLLQNQLVAPALTNDFIDVNGNGIAGQNPPPQVNRLEQLAPTYASPFLSAPPPRTTTVTSGNGNWWIVTYRATGSVNGFQELVDFASPVPFVGVGQTGSGYDPDGILFSRSTRSIANRTQFIDSNIVGLCSNPAFNGQNPGAIPVRSALTLTNITLLDIATLHEDEARSLGVHVHRLRLAVFLLVALLTASAVTLAGPIGFVGLVCPHLARLLGGPAHRGLVPAAALAGVCMLLAADVLVRALDVAGGRLPIGVITALVGGPVFLLMLRTEARRFTR